MRIFVHIGLLFFTILSGPALGKVYESFGEKFTVKEVFKTEGVIWGITEVSDSEVLLSLRKGKIFWFNYKTGQSKEIKNVPEVWSSGQGGLLDIYAFKKDEKTWIFLTYSEPIPGGEATTSLIKGEWKDGKLINQKRIFRSQAQNSKTRHFGSRVVVTSKDELFMSVGDRGERDKAQELNSHQGKILRLNLEGKAMEGNPFVGKEGALPEIWSYGHRNPQGLGLHPKTGELWSAEFGPRGGDEINLIKPGLNYGWPVITYGREYWGPSIGVGTHKEGMEQPIAHYTPSISPSGMDFYSGDLFSKWKGHLFLAALGDEHLHHIVLDGTKILKQAKLLEDLNERIRQVRKVSSGHLLLSTDSGKVFKLSPAP
jgi:glucose/arabinose dehydrogenase